jgi:two-component system, response regulator YesN
MNNLLIVDDEWLISDSLSSLDDWAKRGINVIGTASNGKEAIQVMNQHHVNFIITDIRMPEMDGLELTEYVNKYNDKINIIIISGYEEFDYAYKALKYQVKGYVLKPIDLDELFNIVDDILRSSQKPEQNNTEDEKPPKSYHENLVLQAQVFAENNLDQSITLNDIANKVHLNPHYFGQIFKKTTGESFTYFLTQVRMEKAAKLLKKPEIKIYEISNMVGYSDSKYFTKLFQKHFNITPTEYRSKLFNRV